MTTFCSALLVLTLVAGGGKAEAVSVGNYIVVLNDDVIDPAAVAAQHALAHGGQVNFVYHHALKGYSMTLPTSELAALRADPLVRFVSEDRGFKAATTCDPRVCQITQRPIRRIAGNLSSTRSGDGSGTMNINVAVLDSGIDTHHPDLNVVGGKNCSRTRGPKSFEDDEGHGTIVAGLFGAKDNTIGVVGVAPGANLWAVGAR